MHVEYLTPGGQIINLLLAGNLLQYLYSISRNAIFYANVYIEFRFMYMFILWSVIAPHEGCKCNVTPGYVPKEESHAALFKYLELPWTRREIQNSFAILKKKIHKMMSQHPDSDQGIYVVLLRHITAVPTSYN